MQTMYFLLKIQYERHKGQQENDSGATLDQTEATVWFWVVQRLPPLRTKQVVFFFVLPRAYLWSQH